MAWRVIRHRWTALTLGAALAAGQPTRAEEWIGTWAASPQPVWGADFPVPLKMPRNLWNEAMRQVVRVSIGGHRVRVVLSNAYGDQPLMVGAAHVAKAAQGGAIVLGSDRTLTFSDEAAVVIPPGAPVVSHPVNLDVDPLSSLAVSLFLPETTPLSTVHWEGVQTATIAQGNRVGDEQVTPESTMTGRAFLTEVMVDRPQGGAAAVVAFGANSTPDANRRWPDVLAERLQGAGRANVAVLNGGISGARVLNNRMGVNALARFTADVAAQPYASAAILMMGINGIGWPGSPLAPNEEGPAADAVIESCKQLIIRAHLHGVRIIGATLTPFAVAFQGKPFEGYYSEAKEREREAVNAFIRSDAFDGVIDFDAAVRDPADPKLIQARFDSGDHLRPNDAGYATMTDASDLGLLSPMAPR